MRLSRAANPRVRPGPRLDGCKFKSGPPTDYEHATPRAPGELLALEPRMNAIIADQIRRERDREERRKREGEGSGGFVARRYPKPSR